MEIAADPSALSRRHASPNGAEHDMKPQVHAIGHCHECGSFRVAVEAVTIRYCADEDTWAYRLRCPICQTVLLTSLAPSVARQALRKGARVEAWTLCTAFAERDEGGDMLSLADLDGLRADLDCLDAVDVLRASMDSA
jgi:hypothetical protein